jgi:hypothetical protein
MRAGHHRRRAHITAEAGSGRGCAGGGEHYGFLIVGSQDITIRELAIEAGQNDRCG